MQGFQDPHAKVRWADVQVRVANVCVLMQGLQDLH